MIRTRASCASTLVACLAWGLPSAPAAAERWKAPNPAELALTAPAIDKDADAEILEWDVRVVEEFDGESPATVFDHYIRLKIFTDRGRDTYGRVDMTHADSVRIFGVVAGVADSVPICVLLRGIRGRDAVVETIRDAIQHEPH